MYLSFGSDMYFRTAKKPKAFDENIEQIYFFSLVSKNYFKILKYDEQSKLINIMYIINK